MLPRPVIGQPAPGFALAEHGTNGATWSLDDHLGAGPIVVIFHRHIH
ncbi:MAG: hypothetical protein AB8G14_13900 [Ilumatobacter sp.]